MQNSIKFTILATEDKRVITMIDTRNFKSMFDLLRAFSTEEKCIEHLEILRWNGNIVSPFDATSKVYKCANHRYKCKNTGKYFNAKTGTIFENTNFLFKSGLLPFGCSPLIRKAYHHYSCHEIWV